MRRAISINKLRTYLPVYRTERNMKQEELAALVNVRRETISRLEKGLYNPYLKLAMDISKVFNMPVEKLFEFYEGE
ncbi:helix-turn-helix transcriptional regulator [Caproiciproducens sp.]|uniref:helix-turn-helix transcriptional regulator n=1 Tax=Caproiciproducens sp. TaxID=1954376 RepID=UPI002896E24B|nr:helix-turn-helix transcriptional regulator [Caproiciproducens sp.]